MYSRRSRSPSYFFQTGTDLKKLPKKEKQGFGLWPFLLLHCYCMLYRLVPSASDKNICSRSSSSSRPFPPLPIKALHITVAVMAAKIADTQCHSRSQTISAFRGGQSDIAELPEARQFGPANIPFYSPANS